MRCIKHWALRRKLRINTCRSGLPLPLEHQSSLEQKNARPKSQSSVFSLTSEPNEQQDLCFSDHSCDEASILILILFGWRSRLVFSTVIENECQIIQTKIGGKTFITQHVDD
ncbi:MAG: hypothetical protein RLZZ224_1979, partial [Verrucomicrobiota bacterium]